MGDVIDFGEARRSREAPVASNPYPYGGTTEQKRSWTMRRQREELQQRRQQVGAFDKIDWTDRERTSEIKAQSNIISHTIRDLLYHLSLMPVELEDIQQLITDSQQLRAKARRLNQKLTTRRKVRT